MVFLRPVRVWPMSVAPVAWCVTTCFTSVCELLGLWVVPAFRFLVSCCECSWLCLCG